MEKIIQTNRSQITSFIAVRKKQNKILNLDVYLVGMTHIHAHNKYAR